MPIAAPGASASAGPPSGSSIWNSFTRDSSSDVKGFAAAATALLVRIVEGEAALQLLFGIFDRVAEPGAAAGPHADPHADRRLAALGEQCLYALRRGIRHQQGL